MDNKYISELTQEEKLVFVKIFCRLINIDNSVEKEEIEFLKVIANRYGLASNIVVDIIKTAKSIDYKAEASKITNRQHGLELIKEMCVLSNIDDNIEDSELDMIIDVAEAMNIEDEKVLLINRWVLDSAIVLKTGQIIMERSDA
jgi:uncharacterized tellurite resistance protein B-like protein